MYIAIIYSIADKKSEIIYISNDELEALNALMDRSALLSMALTHRVNVINKHTIHVYHHDIGYVSTSVKISHILELLEYDGEIIHSEPVESAEIGQF